MRRVILIVSILVFYYVSLNAQTFTKWPLQSIKFTGNYGELRPNHFHAGLDFSAGNDKNQPIYAVKSGYVSRIKISPYGYGKVLYITHSDGKVSVYAHQSKFCKSIEAYVNAEQLKQQSYEVELLPSKTEIKINEGDIIGYMGNSGGSTAPHLHFELRDEITEVPLNPLKHYKFNDEVKPVCTSLAILNCMDTISSQLIKTMKVNSVNGSLHIHKDTIVLNTSNFSFAFSGYDREIINGSKNNIYEVKISLDNKLYYHHQLNFIPFDFANYINEYSFDYKGSTYQKCFVPQIFPANMYKTILNRGVFQLSDTLFHSVKFEFSDENGKKSDLKFMVRTKSVGSIKESRTGSGFVYCLENNTYPTLNYTVTIPAKSLYNHGYISLTDNFEKQSQLEIKIDNTFLKSPGVFSFKLNQTQAQYVNKLVVKNGRYIQSVKVKEGIGEANFKVLGSLEVLIDTIPPKIRTQLNTATLNKHVKTARHISFIISDDLSGILKYNLFVNRVWVIAEFDAKSKLLTYTFDSSTPKGEVSFELNVEDRVGNKSKYSLNLTR